MKSLILAFVALTAALANPAALAHGDELMAGQKAPNGGQLRQAGVHHFELVVARDSKEAKDNPVVVHVTDHAGTKVSIVGAGMKSHAGIASQTFESLAKESINIQMISTSEIKISCVVEEKYTELAVRVLHKAFGLGKNEVSEETGV